MIAFNRISGAGYCNHPACAAGQPYVTFGVDTRGSVDSFVFANF